MSFTIIVALLTLVALLTKVIRILLKWKYIQDKKLFFWGRYVVIARAEIFIHGKTFIPVTEVWGFASPPSLEHFEIFKKERMAKQDVGNPISPMIGLILNSP